MKGENVKRCRLYLFLSLLSLFIFIPTLSAMPGDCYDTCDVTVDCASATDTCAECVVEYDTDECIEWRQTTCQAVGACGQCEVLSQWTQKSSGPWTYWKSYCWTDPRPDIRVDTYSRPHYIDTYQRQRCAGGERVVLVARKLDYTQLCNKNGGACKAGDPMNAIGPGGWNCPF